MSSLEQAPEREEAELLAGPVWDSYKEYYPAAWRADADKYVVFLRLFSILFVPNVPYRNVLLFTETYNDVALGTMYDYETCAITDHIYHNSHPSGQLTISATARTSEPFKGSFLYLLARFSKPETDDKREAASAELNRLCATARLHFGGNCLFSKIAEGELKVNGALGVTWGSFTVPFIETEPTLTEGALRGLTSLISRREGNCIDAAPINQSLELIEAASVSPTLTLSLLLRWSALEVLVSGRDVKSAVKRALGITDSEMFKLGVYHFERMRHLIVHTGLQVRSNHRIECENVFDALLLATIAALLNVKSAPATQEVSRKRVLSELNDVLLKNDKNWVRIGKRFTT